MKALSNLKFVDLANANLRHYGTRMMTSRWLIFGLLAAFCLTAVSAQAQTQPKQIGSYKSWEAYVFSDKGKQSCFISATPAASNPKKLKRGDIYFMVAHRPAESVKNEVSLYIGYPFKPGSEARLKIGSKAFKMVTNGENAWPDPKSDTRIVNLMIRGSDMTVEGLSKRGNKTKDRYSLLGFTAAHRAITKACKM